MFFSRKYRIHIPKPCHEDWNKMTPVQKGRFCDSCQKNVTDFSTFTEAQIIEFIRHTKNDFCGRFRSDQMERTYVVKPLLQISAQRRFFQYLLSGFVGWFGFQKAVAQDSTKIIQTDSLATSENPIVDTVALAKADTTILAADSLQVTELKWDPECVGQTEPVTVELITIWAGGGYWIPTEEPHSVFDPPPIREKIPALLDTLVKFFSNEIEEKKTLVDRSEEKKAPIPPSPKQDTISDAILPEEIRQRSEQNS